MNRHHIVPPVLALALAFASFAQEKPAEQIYKNIQVFQGLPSSQLLSAMSFMAASLGVSCPHCHVPNQFEKDDKQPKQTARRMIRMMHSINQENFGGKREVNCYTCHRGQLQPASIPAIPQRPAQAPVAKPAAAKSSDPLPTVDQALEKYLQALGGKAAVAKLTTRLRKGFLEAGGMRIPLETYEKAPNRSLMIGQFPNGKAYRGFDGASGWEQNPGQPPREATGESLARLKDDAEFYHGLRLKELYKALAVKGRDKVGEREVIVIEATGDSGGIEKIYFDAETGLLLRKLEMHESPLGSLPLESDFADYREVDGVRLPFAVRQSRPDVSLTTRFDETQHNVSIDETKFSKPAPPR